MRATACDGWSVWPTRSRRTTFVWLAPGNCEGGWGFNYRYTNEDGLVLSRPEANLLSNDVIQTNSFFTRFDDDGLYGPNGSIVAKQPAMHRQLLADAIPALSFAMGRNDLGGFGSGAVDMYGLESGWPEERRDDDEKTDHWLHGDIKEVAYPFTFTVFDDVVQRGGLDQ